MADVVLGSGYTPAWRFVDSNGSPITSGITGTLSLYYANGTSTSAVTSGSLTHLGNGYWGLAIAATYLASAGLYYTRTGSISGTATLGAQEQAFTVGEANPDELTLRDLLIHIVTTLGDGFASTSTGAGSTTTLVDTLLSDSGLNAGEWIGAALLILEPGAVADTNPVKVTNSTNGGTLTFTPAVTSVGSGIDYLLIHRRGSGKSYRTVLQAVLNAARRYRPREFVRDDISLTTDTTLETSVPRGFKEVTRVWLNRGTTDRLDWREVAPSLAKWDATRRKIVWKVDPGSGIRVAIGGYLDRQDPALLTSVVPGPWTQIADEVVGELSLGKRDRATLLTQRGRAQRARR